jgi:hypothetical protein
MELTRKTGEDPHLAFTVEAGEPKPAVLSEGMEEFLNPGVERIPLLQTALDLLVYIGREEDLPKEFLKPLKRGDGGEVGEDGRIRDDAHRSAKKSLSA